MAAVASLRERWPFPTLRERAVDALGQTVLTAQPAYRVHRFIPFAVAYLGSALVATSVSQTVESALFLGGWLALWVAFRLVGVFSVLAVTPTDVIILKGLGALSPEVAEPYNSEMTLDRRPQRIAVGGQNYRLTARGWRAVLGSMMRGST